MSRTSDRAHYERITGDLTEAWHPRHRLADHYPADTRLPFDVAMFRAHTPAYPDHRIRGAHRPTHAAAMSEGTAPGPPLPARDRWDPAPAWVEWLIAALAVAVIVGTIWFAAALLGRIAEL